MPSSTDLLTLTMVLAALTMTTSATVVGAATDGRKKVVRTRKLRRGDRPVTQIDNLDSIAKKGGLEEDVEFWTNMVRKTQYMSLPPVPAPEPSLPPVVVEPPSFASEPPVGGGTVVPGPTPSSLPPVVSSGPPVVSSLPPVVSSEPPVVSSLPPVVASEPPIGTSSPPIPAPIPSLPPVVASEPPVVSEPPVMASSPPVGGGGGFICPQVRNINISYFLYWLMTNSSFFNLFSITNNTKYCKHTSGVLCRMHRRRPKQSRRWMHQYWWTVSKWHRWWILLCRRMSTQLLHRQAGSDNDDGSGIGCRNVCCATSERLLDEYGDLHILFWIPFWIDGIVECLGC